MDLLRDHSIALLVRSTMWSRDPTARPGNRIEDGYHADSRCAV